MCCNPNCDRWPGCHIRQIHPVPWYDSCWHLFWIMPKDHFTRQWKNYEVVPLKEVISTDVCIMGCRYLPSVIQLDEPIWHKKDWMCHYGWCEEAWTYMDDVWMNGCTTMADTRKNDSVDATWKNWRATRKQTSPYSRPNFVTFVQAKFWNSEMPLGLGQSSVFSLMLPRQFALESVYV